ncbi:MAG TPA: winged helix DNA-binding domain-containing protein [Candidatus Dormibacteraeota bacterium]|nr:winged helix DNA-binding domain-containing protein [Candidatus Dormibacteraeota bacterium]
MTSIAARRLHAQRLTGKPFASPVDAVRALTAVQSQDYGGGKWALGLRTRGVTEADLDRLYDEGAILRTHVLRPTWHFLLPEDIRWMLELTGPRITRALAGRHRELELDAKVVARASAAFVDALAGGRHLTRPELGEVLRKAHISPDGQRLPHLLSHAELDGLITSGARRGKLHTYALLEERATKARRLQPAEAVAELTLRYFKSHGPAQLQDFAWWSGLTLADARKGIAAAGKALENQTIDGKDYWFGADAGRVREVAGAAHLLPNFDEYTVAYRDRGEVMHAGRLHVPGLVLSNVVTVAGKIRGSWRRTLGRRGVRVEISALDQFTPGESAALEAAGRRFGRYLERPVHLAVRSTG